MNQSKKYIYNRTIYGVIVLIFINLIGCKNETTPNYIQIQGKALGTSYNIEIKSTDSILLKKSVDSIVQVIEQSMSLTLKESTLYRYNHSDSTFCFNKNEDIYFQPIFNKAKEIYLSSQGAFNPAVQPLIQYYGFGSEQITPLKREDTLKIKALVKLIVFDSIQLIDQNDGTICLTKPSKDVMLNFNAIYPGFAIDVIASFFEQRGLKDFKINIGSEYRAMGNNQLQKAWVIGIERPEAGQANKHVDLPLLISNKSMVTNGNYQKMYEVNGQKYSHIISPFTGISHPTDILSVTVIADDCTTADAFATAFMVLGLDKSLELAEQLKGVEACFIYDSDDDGVYEFKTSRGFSKYYLNNEQK